MNENLEKTPEAPELFYIKSTGYVGNSIIWWSTNSQGYTTNLDAAGKYSREDALQIVNASDDQLAYLCSKIDNAKEGIFRAAQAGHFTKADADIKNNLETLKSNI